MALSNILRMSFVVFTSLENYPIITIVPKNVPVSNTPAYLAFEQIGAGITVLSFRAKPMIKA